MKRLLTLIVSAMLVLPCFSVNAKNEDICSPWAVDGVNMAEAVGIAEEDVKYLYTKPITRKDFCELIYNLILTTDYFENWYNEQTNNGTQPIAPFVKRPFEDTDNEAVYNLHNHNIVNGKTETEFAPDDLLTREEAATIIVRMVSVVKPLPTTQMYYYYKDIEQVSDWASASVQAISNLRFMKGIGDNKFAPQETYTAEQAITTLLRVYNAFENDRKLMFVDKDGNVILTDEDVASCTAIYGEISAERSEWYVELTLTPDGQEKYRKATKIISQYTNNQISVFFNGTEIAAPKIMDEMNSDSILITGDFTEQLVKKLEGFFEIPLDLLDAYKYFDENLNKDEIKYIKNCSDDDLAELHFGLGLWIRNNWIYPSYDKIAKNFTDRGIDSPDNMSGLIIYGYKQYLNGQPCDLEDLLQ